jgi:Flp pilus assembly pilin Flp
MGFSVREEERGSLLRDIRGAVYVEYVTLLGLVTVGGSVAVYSLGLPLLQTFRYAQVIIAMPLP